MVGADQLDLGTGDSALEVLDGEFRAGDRSSAGLVAERPRHVREDADLHDVVGHLCRRRTCKSEHGERATREASHVSPPNGFA
jgi:hypothetical protein